MPRAVATQQSVGLAVFDWMNPIAATLDVLRLVHQALPLAWITVVGGVEQRRHIRALLEAGANELVSIRAKPPDTPRTVTLSTGQQSVLFFSTVVGLPLLMIIFGAFIWWRRR